MKALTLFSGIGGFDLAFERAGIDVAAVCEIDKHAQSVLSRHFPNSKLYDDVRKVGIKNHEKGTVDIIAGGFPCQDLSIAGKRKGLDGERSGLWFEFARIIDELEPKRVVIENVPGLLSSAGGRDFTIILQWLADRGYCVAWRVLDAQYFGVAQRRRRVFVVASFGNGRAAEVLFERESSAGNPSTRREAGKGIADTFTIRSGKGGGSKGYLGAESLAMTLGGQQQHLAFDAAQITTSPVSQPLNTLGQMSVFGVAKTITTREAQSMDSETMNFIVSPDTYTINLANSGANQNNVKKSNVSDTLDTWGTQAVAWEMQHASEAYRESGSDAPTLQARMGTGGNQVPMVGVRRLTPLECERLQGFPDGWTEGQSDAQRYKQLGNAVAVPVVEWIAKRIVAIG